MQKQSQVYIRKVDLYCDDCEGYGIGLMEYKNDTDYYDRYKYQCLNCGKIKYTDYRYPAIMAFDAGTGKFISVLNQ